jgi:hypothetical protein
MDQQAKIVGRIASCGNTKFGYNMMGNTDMIDAYWLAWQAVTGIEIHADEQITSLSYSC